MVLVRTVSPQSVSAKYAKYPNFLSENFQFLVVKFSVYLNRHVFVMDSNYSCIEQISMVPNMFEPLKFD